MYFFIISSVLYLVLAYLLYSQNKYLTYMALYAAFYFILAFCVSLSMNLTLLKTYYSIALFIDAIGLYIVCNIIAGKKAFTIFLTLFFLVLGFLGVYMTFISDIGIVMDTYFFKIIVPEPLWSYTQYVLFYPGLIIIFFFIVIGLENIDTSEGRRVIPISILALTFGLILYYSVLDSLYAFAYLIANILGAVIMIMWEVKERYL